MFDVSSPCILAVSSLSNSTARQALHDELEWLDTSSASSRVETWRDEPNGNWAIPSFWPTPLCFLYYSSSRFSYCGCFFIPIFFSSFCLHFTLLSASLGLPCVADAVKLLVAWSYVHRRWRFTGRCRWLSVRSTMRSISSTTMSFWRWRPTARWSF